ncbi:hypothetical protein BCEP27_30045 [Burkholderia cepacia]
MLHRESARIEKRQVRDQTSRELLSRLGPLEIVAMRVVKLINRYPNP